MKATRPILGAALLVLAVALPSGAQTPERQAVALLGLPFPSVGKYNHRERIRSQYDRRRDTTRMWVSISVSDVSLKHVLTLTSVKYALDVFATYPGRELLDYPRLVFLRFHFSDSEVMLFDGHDAEAGELTFVLDDTARLVIRDAVPIASFLQLVNASTVEGRLPGVTFAMDKRDLEALRDFASRLNPLAPVMP